MCKCVFVCVCVLLWKEKTISCVCVSHTVRQSTRSTTQHSQQHAIHLLRIPLSAHSLYSFKRFRTFLYYARDSGVSTYLYSCSLVFFFPFYFIHIFFHHVAPILVFYFIFFSLCYLDLSSCVPCNRIKWRMISYFLTSNYTTAVLIWLMRWKATEKKLSQASEKRSFLKIRVIEKYARPISSNGTL